MSFALTTLQVRARTKTVTRRVGWRFLKPGDLVQAVVKSQGLKKGETVEKLAVLRIVDVHLEPLCRLTDDLEYGFLEIEREGFGSRTPPGQHPDWQWPSGFVEQFCATHRPCEPQWFVTRIEFTYEDGGA